MSYYPGSKLRTDTRGNKGKQEKLTEEEQDDHARDERLPKLVFYVECVHYFLSFIHTEHLYSASSRELLRGAPDSSTAKKSSLCLYCVCFNVIGYVTTKLLQQDTYLGWLLCEIVSMLNIYVVCVGVATEKLRVV